MDSEPGRTTRRRIIEQLGDGPATGPELAASLDISRSAVWKQVEALRADGLAIRSDTEGYRVEGTTGFGASSVAFGLEAAFDVEFHDRIESTNRRARALGAEERPETAVIAGEQTAGRGRLDRQWRSPPGGVYVSLLCRPDLPAAEVPLYTLAAAVATTRAVRSVGVMAGIKWPNDVLIGEDQQKVAGILTEMRGEADRASWVVVGVGLNVGAKASELPHGAARLASYAGPVDRAVLTRRLIDEFDSLRATPASVLPAWRELALTLGRRVRVQTPRETIVGEAVDIELPGQLVVRTEQGHRRIPAGDCEHLRPD